MVKELDIGVTGWCEKDCMLVGVPTTPLLVDELGAVGPVGNGGPHGCVHSEGCCSREPQREEPSKSTAGISISHSVWGGRGGENVGPPAFILCRIMVIPPLPLACSWLRLLGEGESIPPSGRPPLAMLVTSRLRRGCPDGRLGLVLLLLAPVVFQLPPPP